MRESPRSLRVAFGMEISPSWVGFRVSLCEAWGFVCGGAIYVDV